MPSWPEAVTALTQNDYDLVITHWGWNKAQDRAGHVCPVGERLLVEMRAQDLRAPVIVFSTADFAHENRPVALRLGAREYLSHWSRLFREIAQIFQ